MACFTLNALAKASSNLAVRGPIAKMPESKTSITADFSASVMLGFDIGIIVPRNLVRMCIYPHILDKDTDRHFLQLISRHTYRRIPSDGQDCQRPGRGLAHRE